MNAVVEGNPWNTPTPSERLASANRATLRRAGVTAIDIIGGLGCGKTTLIAHTVERLAPRVHVGLVTCDPAESPDLDRVRRLTEQVARVHRWEGAELIDPRTLHDALNWLDLAWLDLLFIEQPGPTFAGDVNGPGRRLSVAMFSVPAGHDVASRNPDLVRSADLVILNKADLCAVTPFDLASFRADVARLNPRVEVIELCATSGAGMDRWLEWLRSQLVRAPGRTGGNGSAAVASPSR